MNQSTGSAADRECSPGELMRMVADGLAAHGFEIREPQFPDERRLTITNLKDMRGSVIVEDCGYCLEYAAADQGKEGSVA